MLLAGSIPADLRGRLYRVGPTPVRRGGLAPSHIFDGDGRIDCISFPGDGKTVELSSRIIETPEFISEERADKFLFRGSFGTAGHVSLRKMKNPSNTSLVWHAGELLALWEGGYARSICPETLACLGPHTMGGTVSTNPPFTIHHAVDHLAGMGGHAVSAHPIRDSVTGRMIFMLSTYSPSSTKLRFIEFCPDSWDVHSERSMEIDGFTHVHSFAVTPNDYIFFLPPLSFDILSFRRGASALDVVDQKRGPTRLVRLPRTSGAPQKFEAQQCYATHVANTTSDSIDYFSTNEIGAGMSLHFHLGRTTMLSDGTTSSTTLDKCVGEFPTSHPSFSTKKKQHIFYAGSSRSNSPMDSWIKMNLTTCRKMRHSTTGIFHTEPVFVPRGHEEDDDGYLVGFGMDGQGNYLKIVDAKTMFLECCMRVEGLNMIGLHGIFIK